MDTSNEYILMCKKAIEIQGKIYEDKNKDIFGILQERGLKSGDYIVIQRYSVLSEYEERWRESVVNLHVDFEVINEENRENRIELILNDLKELWYKYPDLRLCQLLHIVALNSGWGNNDLFYIEDDTILNQIKKELRKDDK